MLILLIMAFFGTLYFALNWWNGRYERAAQSILRGHQDRKERLTLQSLTAQISIPTQLPLSSLHIWASLVCAIAGGIASKMWWHKTPVFGIVIGAAIPFQAVALWRQYYSQSYRKDVKTALLFAGAVFREGGTVENWVREVKDRLEGPLRKEFAAGAAQINRLGVSYFLRQMAETSPDPIFRVAMAGIYDNYQSTGDLREFINSVLQNLRQQEHVERSIKQKQKEFLKMFAFPAIFPLMMYLMFQPSVDALLAHSFQANVVLFVGVVGYAALLSVAYRLTRPKILG
jgi:Flp pilus assembly protein TadB